MESKFDTDLIELYESIPEEETFVLLLEGGVRLTGKLSRNYHEKEHDYGKANAYPGDHIQVKDAVLDFPDGGTLKLNVMYVRFSAIVAWGM